MKRIISILFLCVAVLSTSIAMAQEFAIFAKQKVVVADIRDVNDRHLSDGVKKVIRDGIISACTNSDDYEVYEVNLDDIKRQITSSGKAVSFTNICKAIGTKADYIIFTNVKLSSSEVGAQNISIYITSSLYRIATGSEMKTRFAEATPTSSSILSATSKLVSGLLGLNPSVQSQQPANQQQYQQSTYSEPVQPVEKTYKVGDLYDVNGERGVVFAVESNGKHGKMVSLTQTFGNWNGAKTWCNALGNGWRLPTRGELLVIYENKNALNAVLTAMGQEITNGFYWSSIEFNLNSAWRVSMLNGYTYYYDKYFSGDVRAVSAF